MLMRCMVFTPKIKLSTSHILNIAKKKENIAKKKEKKGEWSLLSEHHASFPNNQQQKNIEHAVIVLYKIYNIYRKI